MREFADRTEGKPVQKHEVGPVRETYFGPAPVDGDASPGAPAPPRAAASHELSLRGQNGERMRPI